MVLALSILTVDDALVVSDLGLRSTCDAKFWKVLASCIACSSIIRLLALNLVAWDHFELTVTRIGHEFVLLAWTFRKELLLSGVCTLLKSCLDRLLRNVLINSLTICIVLLLRFHHVLLPRNQTSSVS